MREILFRGKRADNDEWVYGYYVVAEMHDKSGLEYFIIEESAEGQSCQVSPETVGQYTGLTDKRGTKIFEGDIVKKRTYHGNKLFPVEFDGGMFHCGFGGGSSTPTHRYTLEDKQITVEGNIHDNPELLKAVQR